MRSQMVQISPDEARNRALMLCVQREYCAAEMQQKLLDMGCPRDAVDGIITFLTNQNYLNAERFAKAWVSDKFRFNHWGRIKLRYGLQGLNIDSNAIADALAEISEDDYIQTIRNELSKRAKKVEKPDDIYAEKVKLMRFAASRGYEPNICRPIIDELLTIKQ